MSSYILSRPLVLSNEEETDVEAGDPGHEVVPEVCVAQLECPEDQIEELVEALSVLEADPDVLGALTGFGHHQHVLWLELVLRYPRNCVVARRRLPLKDVRLARICYHRADNVWLPRCIEEVVELGNDQHDDKVGDHVHLGIAIGKQHVNVRDLDDHRD